MRQQMKYFASFLTVLMALAAQQVQAQHLQLGAHVGAIGAETETEIGYGAHLTVVPYDTMGLMLDATIADFDGISLFSSSPAVLFYFPTVEELKVAGAVGGGFYKFENSDMNFGLNAGVVGDFFLTEMLAVGAQFRYHALFDSGTNSLWNVFLTLSMKFSTGDGW